jgi:hypothetical protein
MIITGVKILQKIMGSYFSVRRLACYVCLLHILLCQFKGKVEKENYTLLVFLEW